ncbi:MAG TPA: tetratricopeptide repeat protein [Candidatus Binatia bacterium]|nr:tetratricopeptide repeat protein [Candidatus Binatia bacterium]
MSSKTIRGLVTLLAITLCANSGWPQAGRTRVDGRITKAGKSLAGVLVVLSNQDTFEAFRATTDKYGTFRISDVARGTYIVSILGAADEKLYRQALQLASEPDAPIELNLDIVSGPTGPPASTPQASAPAATGAAAPDAKRAELEALVRRYNSALRAGDHQAEIAALEAIVAADPTSWDYLDALGNAQMTAGDYEHAAESFEKGIQAGQQLASSAPSSDPTIQKSDRDRARDGVVQMLVSQGNAYLNLKKNDKAIASYSRAAELAPDPSIPYFNLCVLHYNAGNQDAALAACDKAISANPTKADAYFIKGSMLFFAATKTNKDGSRVVPPGTAEALRKYLQLAPAGTHAKDARQMLQLISNQSERSGTGSGKP